MAALKMTRGDDRVIQATVTGLPTWAGARCWFTVKKAYADTDGSAVFQKDSNTGATAIDISVAGTALIKVNHADTATLPNAQPTRLFYDFQVKDATGKLITSDKGTLTVEPEVTQAT